MAKERAAWYSTGCRVTFRMPSTSSIKTRKTRDSASRLCTSASSLHGKHTHRPTTPSWLYIWRGRRFSHGRNSSMKGVISMLRPLRSGTPIMRSRSDASGPRTVTRSWQKRWILSRTTRVSRDALVSRSDRTTPHAPRPKPDQHQAKMIAERRAENSHHGSSC